MSSSQNDFTRFHDACYKGDLIRVKNLLNSFAVSQPELKEKVLEFLLNGKTTTGCTPLYLACEQNHLNIVKFFYDFFDKRKKIEFLKKVSIEKTERGETCLHVACKLNHHGMVKYLLDKDLYEKEGSLIQLDFEKSHQGKYENIIFYSTGFEKTPVNELVHRIHRKYTDFTPLHMATFYGNIKIIKLLVKNKFDTKANTIELKSGDHYTPYTLLCGYIDYMGGIIKKYDKVIKYFIEKGWNNVPTGYTVKGNCLGKEVINKATVETVSKNPLHNKTNSSSSSRSSSSRSSSKKGGKNKTKKHK